MIAELDPEYVRTSSQKTLIRLACEIFFEGRPLTSRWRWLNPFTTAFLKSSSRLISSSPAYKPIFIVGSGRSGTTVLGKILSIHPECGFLNEPKLMWYLANPEDDLIGSYSKQDGRYPLDASDANERTLSNIQGMYSAFLKLTGSRRVVDKYPEMIFRLRFLRTLFPEAMVIMVLRNGWDTIRSIQKWSIDHQVTSRGEVEDWWGKNSRKYRLLVSQIVQNDPLLKSIYPEAAAYADQLDRAAVEWMAIYNAWVREYRWSMTGLSEVRYERLIGNPSAVLEELMSFCELKFSPRPIEYAKKILFENPNKGPVGLSPKVQELFEQANILAGYR